MGRKPKNKVKATRNITYRGRTGRPTINITEKLRAFIRVRKKGGGTKRLYLDSDSAIRDITKGWSALTITAGRQIEKITKYRKRNR